MSKKLPGKNQCDFIFVPWGYKCILEKGHTDAHKYNEDSSPENLIDRIEYLEEVIRRQDTALRAKDVVIDRLMAREDKLSKKLLGIFEK